jgi:hypothetical protein
LNRAAFEQLTKHAMNRRRAIDLLLLIPCLFNCSISLSAAAQQANGYGPEVKSFLEYIRHEQDELEFMNRHNEISRREYFLTKNRMAVHRQIVLNLVQESGEDSVPELSIVTASEVDQLIEDGTSLLKSIKAGDVIKEKWRYLGSVRRGDTFYIFQRLTPK